MILHHPGAGAGHPGRSTDDTQSPLLPKRCLGWERIEESDSLMKFKLQCLQRECDENTAKYKSWSLPLSRGHASAPPPMCHRATLTKNTPLLTLVAKCVGFSSPHQVILHDTA